MRGWGPLTWRPLTRTRLRSGPRGWREAQRVWGLQAPPRRVACGEGRPWRPRVSRHRPPSLPKRVSPPPAPGPRGLGPLRAEAKALPSCLQRMPPWGHQVLPWKEGSSLETPPCCVPQGLGRAPGWSPADHGGFQNHCPALSQVLGMHSAWGPGLFFFFFCLPQCFSGSGFSSQRKAASSEFEECQLGRPWYFHQVSTALAFPQRSLRKHVPHP